MANASVPSAWATPARTTHTVLFVCWLAILFEGYDVGVMGAVLPALAEDKSWGLTSLQLGVLGSYVLAAVFVVLIPGRHAGTLPEQAGAGTKQALQQQ
ncbi:hypothetical protein [Achromobacter sp.]|uniref:hypothetical protein n=1 Tax=Achromobacter sp. TaxID=134375 RepID=UPI003C70E210